MAIRSTPWPAGTPCWVDLATPDVSASAAFYSAVLGWSFVDLGPDLGGYHIAQTRGHAAAAVGPATQPDQPVLWTVYLASDDVDGTAKLVTEHGGTLVLPPGDIPGSGRMALAADPAGATFGIWQEAGMIGTEIVNEPGSLTWTDARLTDPDAGRRFYAGVFGYTYAPVPGAPGDYSTFAVDGEIRGGIGGAGEPGTPSHWLPWFSCTDHRTSVAAATRAGGTVLMAPSQTPFGWMGVLTDPFGAIFGLHSPLAT